jgi:hypothetical protein
LLVGVCVIYGRRARTPAGQGREVPEWARGQGFSPAGDTEAVRRTGLRLGLSGVDRKLFAGIAATPLEENVQLLLHHAQLGLWLVQQGIRNGNPRRAEPRTALGKALDYVWANVVAVELPGTIGPLLVTRRRGMVVSLWIHRRLRLKTGDRDFDRAFGVLGSDAGHARRVLEPSVRSWLLAQRVPLKTVLVVDGGWCYAARHEPLRPGTVRERIDLVTGFAERLPSTAWTAPR